MLSICAAKSNMRLPLTASLMRENTSCSFSRCRLVDSQAAAECNLIRHKPHKHKTSEKTTQTANWGKSKEQKIQEPSNTTKPQIDSSPAKEPEQHVFQLKLSKKSPTPHSCASPSEVIGYVLKNRKCMIELFAGSS